MVSVIMHVYVDHLNVYINSSTTRSIKEPIIYKLQSINVVIIMPNALDMWSHSIQVYSRDVR